LPCPVAPSHPFFLPEENIVDMIMIL